MCTRSQLRESKPTNARRSAAAFAMRNLFLLLAILLLPLVALHVHAQGCAQCLDTTRATPPAVQAAYRHAILLLVGVASALFLAGVILLRREP